MLKNDEGISYSEWKVDQFECEYQIINNQRMNVARFIQIWNTISIPAAIIVYVSMSRVAIERDSLVFLALSWSAPSVFLFYVAWVQEKYNAKIVDLYPRILALECLLSYKFFRSYLSGEGPAFLAYVEEIESKFVSKSGGSSQKYFDQFWPDAVSIHHKNRENLLMSGPRSAGAIGFLGAGIVSVVLLIVTFFIYAGFFYI